MMSTTLAVVGGGASGTLVALHALARPGVRVVLVEPRAEAGRGVAYATPHGVHRLNVPAGKMSAFPDDPGDFLDWLRSGPLPDATAATFAPRGLFGHYLADRLDRAATGASLRIVRDTAVAVTAGAGPAGGTVRLASGGALHAERVVLALGQTSAGAMPVLSGLPAGVVVADPWAPGALDGLGPRVLLVGTGLTMLDVALVLAERGVRAMTAVSRRGLVARAHALPGPAARAPAPGVGLSLAETLRAIRAEPDWRAAIDALRPTTAARWAGFTDAERRSALRHLRPYWDVHRHRAAPEVAAAIDALRTSGRLTVVAGRVRGADVRTDGVAVRIARRRVSPTLGGGDAEAVVDHVVLCTGARPVSDAPVVAGLVAEGAARLDPLGLGVETDAEGALVGADGRASDVLFTLGPLRQGALWETTAIPEIRAQAERLASRLYEPV